MVNKTAPKAPAPKAPAKAPAYADLSPEELKDLALEKGLTLSGEETPEKLIEMLTGETVEAKLTEKVVATTIPKAPAKPAIEEATLADGDVLP